MHDPYLDLIDEQWNNIAMIYNSFLDKKPIIEYDVDDQKIFSYPAIDYINTLTERTRSRTKKQYKDACNKHQFLLFIKDEKNQKLRSYIFDITWKI
ncbi:MAG: hypothetical protein ACXW1W_13925 [Methylococcaceae bacterium]